MFLFFLVWLRPEGGNHRVGGRRGDSGKRGIKLEVSHFLILKLNIELQ